MKILFCAMVAAALCGVEAADKPAKPETTAAVPGKPYGNVNPETFDKMRRADTNTVVLDVRTKKEYQEGHIPGSVLIDYNSPDFAREIAKLDKSKTYLVHCGAGGRSARACSKMADANFTNLFNLEGGFGAWQKAGKPVEKPK
jgi:phage shock protein E